MGWQFRLGSSPPCPPPPPPPPSLLTNYGTEEGGGEACGKLTWFEIASRELGEEQGGGPCYIAPSPPPSLPDGGRVGNKQDYLPSSFAIFLLFSPPFLRLQGQAP